MYELEKGICIRLEISLLSECSPNRVESCLVERSRKTIGIFSWRLFTLLLCSLMARVYESVHRQREWCAPSECVVQAKCSAVLQEIGAHHLGAEYE